jgi:hypothetical protein
MARIRTPSRIYAAFSDDQPQRYDNPSPSHSTARATEATSRTETACGSTNNHVPSFPALDNLTLIQQLACHLLLSSQVLDELWELGLHFAPHPLLGKNLERFCVSRR